MINNINFFSHYQGQKKSQTNEKLYIYSLGGLLGAAIIGTLAWNTVSIVLTDKTIKSYEEKLNDSRFLKAKVEALDLIRNLDILTRYDAELSKILKGVNSRDVVSTELLNKLSSTLPSQVSFTGINITKSDILVQAQSTSITAIAEVQYNLKQLENVQDVYIGSIYGNEKYTFDLKIQLKGGE